MTFNTFIVELTCPHCQVTTPADRTLLITSIGEENRGYRLGDQIPVGPYDLEHRFFATGFPGLKDTELLIGWDCKNCGNTSHVSLTIEQGKLIRARAELPSLAQFSRATHVEMSTGESLYFVATGGYPFVAGALMPGWAKAVKNALEGKEPYPIDREVEDAIAEELVALRLISWTGRLEDEYVDPQLLKVREHYDGVYWWLRALDKKQLWPHVSLRTVFPGDPLWAYAEARLREEKWWNALSDERPAKAETIDLLVWTGLDVQGKIPYGVPELYAPLREAWVLNGAPYRSRKLKNELELGIVTLRLGTFEEWKPGPRRIKTSTRFRS